MNRTLKRPIRKPSPDALVAAHVQLGVEFVMCEKKTSGARLAARPAALLAGLAKQDEARLRLAVNPLRLRHPEFDSAAPEAIQWIDP